MKKLIILFLMILSFNALADQTAFIIETKQPLNKEQQSALMKKHKLDSIELLSAIDDEYFSRVYKVKSNVKKKALKESLNLNKEVLEVEEIGSVELFNIFPQSNTEQIGNDPLFKYQWGKYNQKQVVLKEIDDLHNIEVVGKEGIDIGWKAIYQKISPNMKKEITVAVIDTGVDLGHPDLKANIKLNELECNNGQVNLEAEAPDRDLNQFNGDCMGWDFTVPKAAPEARVPFDRDGHGTHVAGIISAVTGNNQGVSAFTNKIKIMPLKVLSRRRLGESMTDRIAQAILYAAHNGADVINMSMGWSKALDARYLRNAVGVANQRNIPVIAAAGNNSSNDKIFPCAYPNVICVGAITNDGQLAKFSNHGGNVDVLAPGDSIMSLTTRLKNPSQFSVKGYDIKSGTSQAAPYVAALAAIMKGSMPNMKLNELSARIFESTAKAPQDLDRDKKVMHGLINFEKALSMRPTVSVKPTFKLMTEVFYTMKDKRFFFRLPIKNYWLPIKNVRVTVSSKTKNIEIKRKEFRFPELKMNQVVPIEVFGDILDVNSDSAFEITVKIESIKRSVTGEGEEQVVSEEVISHGEYSHSSPLSRILDQDESIVNVPVEFNGPKKPLLIIKNKKVVPLLTAITNKYSEGERLNYYIRKIIPRDNEVEVEPGIVLNVFESQKDKLLEIPNELFIADAKAILGFNQLDYNADGVSDYLVRFLIEDVLGNQHVEYHFFDKKLNPLFGENSVWRFFPDVILDNELDGAVFFQEEVSGLGKLNLPVLIARSALPTLDQPTGPWALEDRSVRSRMYYFKPELKDGKVELTTRVIDTKELYNKLRQELKLKQKDSLDFVSVLNQSLEERKQGLIRVLISAGRGLSRTNYELQLKDRKNYKLIKLETGFNRLENRVLNTVINLDGETPNYFSANSFIGFHSKMMADINLVGQDQDNNSFFDFNQIYTHKSKTDHLLGFLSNFISDGEFYSFFQSRNAIVMVKRDKDGNTISSKKPVVRFTFLKGSVFNELYFPVVTKQESKLTPGLYVDGTKITANRVHVLSVLGDELISPIKHSVMVPKGCSVIAPTFVGQKKNHAHMFICAAQNGTISFKYLELK